MEKANNIKCVFHGSMAFTLIEAILAVIIIVILMAILTSRLAGRSEKERIAVAKEDINSNIGLALGLFKMDIGRFPTTDEGITVLHFDSSSLPNWKGPYIKEEPKDPWGRVYFYISPGTRNSDYDLFSSGPNGIEGDNDDIGNW